MQGSKIFMMKKAKVKIAAAIEAATGWKVVSVEYERNKSNLLRRMWLDEAYIYGQAMIEGCILPIYFNSSRRAREIANGECYATFHKGLDSFTIYVS